MVDSMFRNDLFIMFGDGGETREATGMEGIRQDIRDGARPRILQFLSICLVNITIYNGEI